MQRQTLTTLRPAHSTDLEALRGLARVATEALCAEDYTPLQIQTLLRFGLAPSPELIADGHFYVVEIHGRVIAAAAWSARAALFGHTHPDYDGDPADLVDPAWHAARLRACFVHPDYARRGVARTLLAICERAAARAGFTRIELCATPAARRLCLACDYEDFEPMTQIFSNAVAVTTYRMTRDLDVAAPPLRARQTPFARQPRNRMLDLF